MRKIGVFDSGIGGMKIATSIFEQILSTDVYYFADQAFAPYGALSEEEIDKRCLFITEKFLNEGVELIVIACNTATSTSIEKLRNKYDVPFVGVEPDLNYFNRNDIHKSSKVGVLTTPVTQRMEKFNSLRAKLDPENVFNYIPMPLLANLVEKLFVASEENIPKIKAEIQSDLSLRIPKDLDYLVLGCTHYGLIDKLIQELMKVKTICPSSAVVKQVEYLLDASEDLSSETSGEPIFSFCSSGEGDIFKKLNLEWKQRFKSEKLMS